MKTYTLTEHRVDMICEETHDAVFLTTYKYKSHRKSKSLFATAAMGFLMLWPMEIVSSEHMNAAISSMSAAHMLSAEEVLEAVEVIEDVEKTHADSDIFVASETWKSKKSDLTQRGIYMTSNSIARKDGFLEESLDKLITASGNTLVIDVKEHDVFFETTSEIAKDLGVQRKKYDLSEVVKEAKDNGIYTIARFVAAKDRRLAALDTSTQIRHPETNTSVGDVWVDLSNETVLEYNRQLIKDVIESGIDEINLDYIRYPTEYTQAQIGLNGREKSNRVEKFIQMTREEIDKSEKNTKLGISTYAILGWDYERNLERLGQDVARFARYVDVISPMAYPASFGEGAYYRNEFGRSRMYELVHKTMTGYKDILGDDSHKLRPWIQGYRVDKKDMKDQIDAVFDAGQCGFTVWSPSNLYWPLYGALGEVEVPEECLRVISD
ncbi:hypothetical protein HOF56_02845 [Candidatus Peribacteria bacterium]|mgnify:CR=1 FL=1|jgi:hypothetical protein|nr:hypothetical protein [Candidatus Peribacteria bacterium]MBT4021682.1 hypothetical protein [Candidatus Peribacteria bacterium]MBT4240844.1 hypothetical protein [Candidatus Peribacteria bacterium]MBT4473774.1 hypothetical protein [Candidatus Peribacteria bacterium]